MYHAWPWFIHAEQSRAVHSGWHLTSTHFIKQWWISPLHTAQKRLGLGADKVTNSGARPNTPCHLRVMRDDINAAAMVIANDLSGTGEQPWHLDPIPHPWRLQPSFQFAIWRRDLVCNSAAASTSVIKRMPKALEDWAFFKTLLQLSLVQQNFSKTLGLNAATHQCMDVQYRSISKLVPSYIFHDTFIGCHFCRSLEFH